MLRILPVVAAVVASLAYGLSDGLWTNRWGLDADSQEAARRLAALPLTVDSWSAEGAEVSSGPLPGAEADGSLVRQYVNRRTGHALQILIVCGHPGPICRHTPEDCYPRQGYSRVSEPTQLAVPSEQGNAPAELRSVIFQKLGQVAPPLRISWAWSNGQGWLTPDNPRLAFARSRVLFKLYVIEDLSQNKDLNDSSAVVSYLQQLLPQLQEHLFASR
jgi:hypothetical protein